MSKKLGLIQSIPLGIGSIIGSGILFLPSLTYKVSGSDVMLSWILIIALCIPGIIFFNEMVGKLSIENSNLNGLIEIGLGKDVGNSVGLILLGTVVFGMPSAAIVAGSYCSDYFDMQILKPIVAFLLVTVALLVNFFGLNTASWISLIISALLLLCGTFLYVGSLQPISSYTVLKPSFNINNVYSGSVLAFWAFAGFENLTFLYSKFENPKRDLFITIVVSIVVCGALYLGLVSNYAAIVPYNNISDTTGLMQLASFIGGSKLGAVIVSFAITAVLINLISWTGGVLQLIHHTSSKNIISTSIAHNKNGPIYLLSALFYISLFIGLLSPEYFEKVVVVVSTNFLLIYLLLIGSYIFQSSSFAKKALASIVALVLLATLSSSSYLLIYPFVLFVFSIFRSRRTCLSY